MILPSQHKIKSLAEIEKLVGRQKAESQTVVFANGCFDILHVGHVRYLQGARAEGDFLVVALNSDASVGKLKGEGRPLLKERDRAELVAALDCVDSVLIWPDATMDRLLERLQPDVHAKGTDYSRETVPEKETVLGYGGRIAIVGDPKDHSTRDLLQRIREKAGEPLP